MKIFSSNFESNFVDIMRVFLENEYFFDGIEKCISDINSNGFNCSNLEEIKKILNNELSYVKENNKKSFDCDFIKLTKTLQEVEEYLKNIKAILTEDVFKNNHKDPTPENYKNTINILDKEIATINTYINEIDYICNSIKVNLMSDVKINTESSDDNSEKIIIKSTDEAFSDINYKKEDKINSEWHEFLKTLLDKPESNFLINKNTVTNFDIIFRNPKTNKSNKQNKEAIVHLSYNSSRRSEPVFSIGSTTFNSKSFGPKLTSGTLVINADNNVPLSTLHAISNSDSYSIEDLPPLDLFIIPKIVLKDGRFEVLVIRGINFINTQQNNNASSTGIYHSFQFFAKSVEPTNYESVNELFSNE